MFTPHQVSCVTCHVSCVMCHMSCVTCHVSCVTFHLSPVTCHLSHIILFSFIFLLKKKIYKYPLEEMDKVVDLVGEGSVINGAYPVQFSSAALYSGQLSSSHALCTLQDNLVSLNRGLIYFLIITFHALALSNMSLPIFRNTFFQLLYLFKFQVSDYQVPIRPFIQALVCYHRCLILLDVVYLLLCFKCLQVVFKLYVIFSEGHVFIISMGLLTTNQTGQVSFDFQQYCFE